jgi:CheY-like chemotaxis protein
MKSVLVVDDEPAIRNLEQAVLRSAGYDVLTASNGAEALEVMERTRPSVLVLDLQMPVMDGRELMQFLHRMPGHPPVLLVTSFEAGRAQRELGTDAALQKPFLPDDFLARVEELSGRKRPLAF